MLITVNPIFSCFYYKAENIDLNNDLILEQVKNLSYRQVNSSGLEMSNEIKILNELKEGSKIKKILNDHIEKVIKEVLFMNINHRIVNSWATKTKKGAISELHTHSNFWLSAVYYLNGEAEDEFSITFESKEKNNYFGGYNIIPDKYNMFNSQNWIVPVKKGDLIIFPACLPHQISTNISEKTRFSIAVNIFPNGVIGKLDGQIDLSYVY